MRYFKLSFLFVLVLLSCSKDKSNSKSDQNADLEPDIIREPEFEPLGNDAPYIYNQTYQGRNGYVTYYPGNIPIILSIPHGGDIIPEEIPNRTYGTTVTDSNTIELGISISNSFYSQYDIRPYVVINNLKRTKLDANRDRVEAAQGNIYAERAFDAVSYTHLTLPTIYCV